MSSEVQKVQNRSNSDPTRVTDVLKNNFFKKNYNIFSTELTSKSNNNFTIYLHSFGGSINCFKSELCKNVFTVTL